MGVEKRIKRKYNPFAGGGADSGTSTAVASAEATNVVTVTVQLKTANGNNVSGRQAVTVWLSDANTGAGIVAAAPSGGLAVSGGFGTILQAPSANKMLDCITDAAGKLQFAVTEAGAKTCYLAVWLPDGSVLVSNAMTWT